MKRALIIVALLVAARVAHADEVASLAPASASGPAGELEPAAAVASDTVEGGTHWRLETVNGVVHVWRPAGYQASTAGTVIYLHGHRSTSDTAWDEHHLAAQFRESKQNALFIVPDSTTDGEEQLHWESPGALQREVARRTGVARPPGVLVVMGHSGAFRNLGAWLDHAPIDHIILLDALYSLEEDFLAWITSSRHHEQKKLTLVSRDTRRNALRFMKQIPASVGRTKIPDSYDALSKREKNAQILNLRSQYDHMGIVTSGRVIPLVLRRAGLPTLGEKAPPPARAAKVAAIEPAPLPPPASMTVPEPVPPSAGGSTNTLRATPVLP